jgi:peroxiredoxin
MSLINKEVAEFSVQAYVNDEFKTVTREDILGKWSVFFFYPADFTFVCPTELEDLQTKYADFQKAGCEIYSVSCDTHFVHKAWHDNSESIGKITFPMLADPTHELAKDFEVLIEGQGIAERGSFIVNPEGKIVVYEVSAGNVGRNAEELFRKLQASQFVAEHGDQVCPARWAPGAATLKPGIDLVGAI